MIKKIKLNVCLGVTNEKECGFEYMSYDKNSKCPVCGSSNSKEKSVMMLDINEAITSIEEKMLAASCINTMSKKIYSFNTEVVMESDEFKKEIRNWITDNKITALLVCYAYSRGNYHIMENSDNEGFNILLNIPNGDIIVPNTNISVNIYEEIDKSEESGEDYTMIVQDDVYIRSEYLNEDLLLLERSSSSDYNGDNFRETLSLFNYDLVKIIYKEIANVF